MKCLHRDTPPALKWPTEKCLSLQKLNGLWCLGVVFSGKNARDVTINVSQVGLYRVSGQCTHISVRSTAGSGRVCDCSKSIRVVVSIDCNEEEPSNPQADFFVVL